MDLQTDLIFSSINYKNIQSLCSHLGSHIVCIMWFENAGVYFLVKYSRHCMVFACW